jgi:hypothetical protein
MYLAVLLASAGCGAGNKGKAVPVPDARDELERPAPARERVENPLYTSWSRFKKGTSVVHRAVTGEEGRKDVTTTTTTYTLLDVTDERVVVEMQAFTRRYDGVRTNNPPQKLTNQRWVSLPPGVKKPGGGHEEETITVASKEYRAKRVQMKDRNEAGEVTVTTWTSDEVPGGLVKSVTLTPAIGKKTTLELVEVKRP